MNKNSYSLFTLLPIFLLFFAACSDEQGNSSSVVPSVPEGYMAIEIVVPGVSTPATRAIDAIDECDVQTVDVLVFNKENNRFVYHQEGTDIEDHDEDGKRKIFYVKVPQNETYNSIYFMVIANAHSEVMKAIETRNITTDTTKDEVMRMLTFDVPASDPASASKYDPEYAWPVRPGTFICFPMWGISEYIDLNSAITVPPISLVRSVAKIDVGVNFSTDPAIEPGLGNVFKLEEIYVYNAHNRLMIAPEPGSYDTVSGTPGVPNYGGFDSPFTVPSIPEKVDTVNPVYPLRDYNTDKIAHTNEIYVAEHRVGTVGTIGIDDKWKDNFCLVIGARYGTIAAEGTDITYYRVDFIKTTSKDNVITKEFLPILRNHHYKVNIIEVQGRGYNTPDKAFNAMGNTNLVVADITDNNEDLTEFEYNGQHLLGVSKGKYVVDKNEHLDMEIVVRTTHGQGWTATASSTGNWLTITNDSTQSDPGISHLTFSVEANNDVDERTGIITIQSGQLLKDITVVQQNISFIEIVDKQDYYIMDGSKKSFTVKSVYDWKVRVKKDESNILRTFTTSGTAYPPGGSTFEFTMENDVLYHTILDAGAILTFYSPTGEFADHNVPIKGISCFDLGGVYVYLVDQPTDQNWYVYSNTPEGEEEENTEPPFTGSQDDTIRTHSCAAIVPSNSWRLPTQTELLNICNEAYAATGGLAAYNFSNPMFYLSATTASRSFVWSVLFSDAVSNIEPYRIQKSISNTNYRARCVRSK